MNPGKRETERKSLVATHRASLCLRWMNSHHGPHNENNLIRQSIEHTKKKYLIITEGVYGRLDTRKYRAANQGEKSHKQRAQK
jgi:hypothetical protein